MADSALVPDRHDPLGRARTELINRAYALTCRALALAEGRDDVDGAEAHNTSIINAFELACDEFRAALVGHVAPGTVVEGGHVDADDVRVAFRSRVVEIEEARPDPAAHDAAARRALVS